MPSITLMSGHVPSLTVNVSPYESLDGTRYALTVTTRSPDFSITNLDREQVEAIRDACNAALAAPRIEAESPDALSLLAQCGKTEAIRHAARAELKRRQNTLPRDCSGFVDLAAEAEPDIPESERKCGCAATGCGNPRVMNTFWCAEHLPPPFEAAEAAVSVTDDDGA